MELENTRKAVQFDILSKNICKQKNEKNTHYVQLMVWKFPVP